MYTFMSNRWSLHHQLRRESTKLFKIACHFTAQIDKVSLVLAVIIYPSFKHINIEVPGLKRDGAPEVWVSETCDCGGTWGSWMRRLQSSYCGHRSVTIELIFSESMANWLTDLIHSFIVCWTFIFPNFECHSKILEIENLWNRNINVPNNETPHVCHSRLNILDYIGKLLHYWGLGIRIIQ